MTCPNFPTINRYRAIGHGAKQRLYKGLRMKMKKSTIALLGTLSILQTSLSHAENVNGKNLFTQRCAVCHGAAIKGTGPLAKKSNPATPDLTTAAFKKRLNEYPGVIVSSVVLRPNGNLIPKTLSENGVKIPPHAWSIKDLRDLNEYMSAVILTKR
jgi:mono/diheme cytochrome c family protein